MRDGITHPLTAHQWSDTLPCTLERTNLRTVRSGAAIWLVGSNSGAVSPALHYVENHTEPRTLHLGAGSTCHKVAFRNEATNNVRKVTAYSYLARHLLLPCLDIMRGTHVGTRLEELDESQWWPRQRLELLQSQRLRVLIRHAYDRVPYYRRVMNECGVLPRDIESAADLPLLPVLTKEDIRRSPQAMMAECFPRNRLLRGRTSGSTGTPLAFVSSRDSRWSHGMARSLRALAWTGVSPGDPVLRVRGRGEFVEEAAFQRLTRLLSRESFIDPAGFTESSLRVAVQRIARLRPRATVGYPSVLCILADYIRESGSPAPDAGCIVTGGETLFAHQRELLRDIFGNEPFSKYSSFENYEIAMECRSHTGLHIAAEDFVVEVVDEAGQPKEPGHPGRVLVTSLHECGMPLIRYDTADEGSLLEGDCACGRALPRLSGVIGRTGSVIYTPSGKRLSTNTLDSSGLVPLGIRQFQLLQERLDHITVRLIPGSELASSEARTVIDAARSQFEAWLGDDVRVEVEIVDRIAPTPAGKHLYLISNVRPPMP